MSPLSSLRFRLVGTVFLAVAPASVLMYFTDKYLSGRFGDTLPWSEFIIGLLALGAAWFGGERFILKQVRTLSRAARMLGAGDMTSRTGLAHEGGELGELARTFDHMAASLEDKVKERERAEKTLLNRGFQQTVVAALGQFAMVTNDVGALLNQAVMLVAQTLEVEFCYVLELRPGAKELLLCAGSGWKDGSVGHATVPANISSESSYALSAGAPVVVENLSAERRFKASSLLQEHGAVSGISVPVAGHGHAFGVLGAYTARRRAFSEDEIHFLFSLATVLAMAVERLRTEAQLLQSQKMESVGQLAAGVAHDFNNMLTVIQGHSGILMNKPNLPADQLESAQAIYFAAERAATLTRQLLMFSRKNVMKPAPQDLREVVGELSKMLKRLLGEMVVLQIEAPLELPLVKADRGMIEQVIMNLAVNARDAMPTGGTLTIRTDAVTIDPTYAASRPEARPGPCVCLRVRDTGCGMDHATLSRIFEPFFTTKEVGKGTGLGLATVYGIVKQHEGWLEVESQPGQGTTFHVFFPASDEPAKAKPAKAAPAAAVRGGHETILLVEDEPILRDMAHMILQDYGYSVLEAGSGAEALEVWKKHAAKIHLLLTDMVMPGGVSGRDLAGILQDKEPDLRIIYTSGYNVEEANTDFLRRGGATFLQKPYTRTDLANVVRQCLDKKRGAEA